MKVALVGPELEENLGLRYLHASIVKAGYEAAIFDFHSREQIHALTRRILRYDPSVVGLSMVFTGRAREFVSLAVALRAAGYSGHITAGGHFASFYAGRLLRDDPSFDSIIHGEGEEAVVELIRHLSDPGSVDGITYRDGNGTIQRTAPRSHPDDLDSRPFPTRPASFYDYLGLPIANMLAGRGCYANCRFCSINAWYRQNPGKRFRQRRVGAIAREMAQLYHDRGVRIFNFHDDNFFLPAAEECVERFGALQNRLRALRVGRIGIQVKARPDNVDPAVISLLKDLGLFRVFLGVESGLTAPLERLGRGVKARHNHRALEVLRDHDIHTTFNLFLFDPETTLNEYAGNIAFMRRYADLPMNFGRVEVYGGTALERKLRSENRLHGDYFGYRYRIADERCQRAFELFRKVFLPRNFEQGGMNHQAMRLDYYFHLVRHFHPDWPCSDLHERVRALIRALNQNSADILEEIGDLAGIDPPAQASTLKRRTESLIAYREDFDERMRIAAEAAVEEIVRFAANRGRPKRAFFRRAASAAAVALIISVSACEKPAPQLPSAPRSPVGANQKGTDAATSPTVKAAAVRQLRSSEVRAVKKRIATQYGETLKALARKHNFVDQELQVCLALDSDGKVTDAQIRLPPGRRRPGLVSDLHRQATAWEFPRIEEDGACTVTLQLLTTPFLERIMRKIEEWRRKPEPHICEMLMVPMEPESDDLHD